MHILMQTHFTTSHVINSWINHGVKVLFPAIFYLSATHLNFGKTYVLDFRLPTNMINNIIKGLE